MLNTLKEMLTSKKFIASLAGVIVAGAAKIGLDLDTEAVALIVSPIVSYILAQGWADTGKYVTK